MGAVITQLCQNTVIEKLFFSNYFLQTIFAHYIYPIPNVETALSVEKSPNKLFCGTGMHCTVQFSLHKANRRRADLILWEEDSAGSEVFDFG